MAPDRPRRRRTGLTGLAGRRGWLIAGGALLGLLVIAPLASVPAARAVESSLTADLQVSQGDLQRGLKELETGYKNQDAKQVEAAAASFASSRVRLQALANRVRPLDVGAGSSVPGAIRNRVNTLDAVIDMAIHLDRAGTIASQALLSSGLVGGTEAGAPISTSQLTNLLGSVRDELTLAKRSADGVDVSVLPGSQRATLTKALEELRVAVSGLGALWPSLSAVMDFLGLDGPKTYLIEQSSPAELRAGGGFIGTVSLVHADRGHVTVGKS